MMKFFRYMLNYTFLAALLIAGIVGYFYREELYPELQKGFEAIDEQVQQQVEALNEVAGESDSSETVITGSEGVDKVSSEKVSASNEVKATAVTLLEQPAVPEVANVEEVSSDLKPAATETVTDEPDVEPPVIEVKSPVDQLVESQSEAQATPLIEASSEAKVDDAVVSTVEIESVPGGEEKQNTQPGIASLQGARNAFWQGEYEQAEESYRRLAEQQPRNPDAIGELGNLYFAQGRYEEEAAAYSKAADRLAEIGHMGQAMHLVKVLYGLAPEKAKDLEQRLMDRVKKGDNN
ncbi:hypothetical protein BOW53_06585 [Solemya pervernicosa gill symbiont]|uniref:Uncharacterized protein n=2 Tax=Gammaproteobacteria incertae sedis TaxID=118884 RepID=A0A1T2L6Q1_9GAMM|nr:tetratricopeptide repeat protein [Candidatus Reidiella endopervernicosa]OOZ40779.1 hypothetical protein BOW53_06585 [Solemya pervernicosa gill symbiont]QKQ26385.1 tetratricopeptide repeat protein [Candidatus Reidiella endopervernicosa]